MTTSPDSPIKCKRQKTIDQAPEFIDLVDDDDNDDDLVITYVGINLLNKPNVLFCGFTMEEEKEQKRVFFNQNCIYCIHLKLL